MDEGRIIALIVSAGRTPAGGLLQPALWLVQAFYLRRLLCWAGGAKAIEAAAADAQEHWLPDQG